MSALAEARAHRGGWTGDAQRYEVIWSGLALNFRFGHGACVNNSRGDAPEFDGSGGELYVSPSLGHVACVNNSRGDAPEVSPCGSPVPGAPMLITPPRTTTGSHGSCPHHTTGFSREAMGAQGQGENLWLSPTRTGHAHAGVSSQRRIRRIRAYVPARRGPSSSSAR